MKKNNKARRKLRNNPVHAMPGIEKMIGNAVGPLMIREALGDATLPEIAVIAAMIPMLLNVLRSMGPEAAKNAFAKLYPIPEDEQSLPADGADPAHSTSPEGKEKQ